MNPTLYYAVMLITEPQKARRILLAEELENWFMDLFDEEFEDILEGTFKDNQYVYINRIVDKYIEITGVDENNSDEFTRTCNMQRTQYSSKNHNHEQRLPWNGSPNAGKNI